MSSSGRTPEALCKREFGVVTPFLVSSRPIFLLVSLVISASSRCEGEESKLECAVYAHNAALNVVQKWSTVTFVHFFTHWEADSSPDLCSSISSNLLLFHGRTLALLESYRSLIVQTFPIGAGELQSVASPIILSTHGLKLSSAECEGLWGLYFSSFICEGYLWKALVANLQIYPL